MVTERVVPGVTRYRLVFGVGVVFSAATVVGTVIAADHPARAAIDAVVVTAFYTLILMLVLRRLRRRRLHRPKVIGASELPPVARLWKAAIGSVVVWGCVGATVATVTLNVDRPQDFALPGIMLGSALMNLVLGERAAIAAERDYGGKLWVPVSQIRSTPGPDSYIVRPEHPVVP